MPSNYFQIKPRHIVPPKLKSKSVVFLIFSFILPGYAVLFSHSPVLGMVLLIGAISFAVFLARPFWGTLGFIITFGFGNFLNLPITQYGLAPATVILLTGFLAFLVKAVLSKDHRLVIIPMSELRHLLVPLLFFVVLMSLINSRNLGLSLTDVKQFSYCVALYFFVILTIRDKVHMRRAIVTLLCTGALVALSGLLQALFDSVYAFFGYSSLFGADIWFEPEQIHTDRLTGFLAGGDIHGMYMVIIVIFAVCWFFYTDSRAVKWFLGVLLVAALFNVIGAASRGPVLALFASLFVIWLLMRCSRKWLTAGFGLTIGLAFCAIALGLNIDRMYKYEGVQKQTAEYRWHGILMALMMVPDHPFIGSGPYGYELNYHRHAFRAVPEAGKRTLRLHNAYLEVLVDYGMIGFAFFVTFNFLLIKSLFVLARRRPSKERYLIVGVFCGAVGYSLFMLTTGWLVNQNYWLLMAIGSACCDIYGDRSWVRGSEYSSRSRVNNLHTGRQTN